MRRLVKGPRPAILTQSGDRWRDDLIAVLARNEKPSESIKARYRHVDIKNALVIETDGKCAYCESKIRHIAHGDIEHIIPKSKVPSKSFEWDNLTLACDKCNENKGDYYSDDPTISHDRLVDPYVDIPADHFLFMREAVTPRPDSMRGFATERVLKLTRGELVERRRERLDFIDAIIRSYFSAEQEYKQMILDDLFDNHIRESDEYYAVAKAYVDRLKVDGIIPA